MSTALTNSTYANRELSSNGAKQAQVVHIASTDTTAGSKIRVRQAGSLAVDVKSGGGRTINLEPTTGHWSGDYFYVVDGSSSVSLSYSSEQLTGA